MKKTCLIFLFFLITLASCSQSSTSSEALPASSTNTYTPAPSLPPATTTLIPALTPMPTKTPSLVQYSEKPIDYTIFISQTPIPGGEINFHHFSPDGNWVVQERPFWEWWGINGGPPELKIINMHSSLEWLIEDLEFETLLYDPRPNLAFYRWSADSRFIYFYTADSFGCGGSSLYDGYLLQRLTVNTGEIQTILNDAAAYSFALSPDTTKLVYYQGNTENLTVLDLFNNNQKSYSIPTAYEESFSAGSFQWNTNDNEFIYAIETNEYLDFIYLNLENGTHVRFYSGEAESSPYAAFDGWEADKIRLIINPHFDPVINLYDPQSNQITIIGTPTPQP